jgi:hypothetical protein
MAGNRLQEQFLPLQSEMMLCRKVMADARTFFVLASGEELI